MEQTIDLTEFRKLLPERAQVEFERKRGEMKRWFLQISIKIVPYVSEKEHEEIVKSIIKFYGEDLIEVYTETTGYHFYVYLRISQTQPTTVIV